MCEQLNAACALAQSALKENFWSGEVGYFRPTRPDQPDHNPCYWWQAHAIDALLDGYLRTGDEAFLSLAREELKGTQLRNGGTLIHNWYDDMEWMALALLRMYDITGDEDALKRVQYLWADIKTAWNGHCGGGMAWRKDQLDYKNTPANAPAAIIGLRLYQRFHNEEDLAWGRKILEWNRDNLMDPETFYVYDGMNREGDGRIDYGWDFTYNQGVMIGASVEMYRITGEAEWLDLALGIARRAKAVYCDAHGGVMPYEGPDDCGLFRGILTRYLAELYAVAPEADRIWIAEMLSSSAAGLMRAGMAEDGLIGGDWLHAPAQDSTVDLAQHLSGLMLLEMTWKVMNAA